MINELTVDKQNAHVKYNDEKHRYWNDNGDTYISVTTLIGKFEVPYNKEFWSKYKALERLLKDRFVLEKKRLLDTKCWKNEILDSYPEITLELFEKTAQEILDEWDETNRISCERGTKIHAQMEAKFYSGAPAYTLQNFGIGGKFQCKKNHTELDLERGVYPEYLTYYDDEDGFHLAGQIDLLVKDGNDIIIGDFKTNKELKQKSYYNPKTKKYETMLFPLNNIMDCNFMHYTIQLSTYAWMMKKMNPEFNIKRLFLIYFDHEGNSSLHEVEYLEDSVEAMIKEYKKQILKDKRSYKRRKIDYN